MEGMAVAVGQAPPGLQTRIVMRGGDGPVTIRGCLVRVGDNSCAITVEDGTGVSFVGNTIEVVPGMRGVELIGSAPSPGGPLVRLARRCESLLGIGS